MKVRILSILIVAAALSVLLSCQGSDSRSFAVLLWPPEESGLEAGSIFPTPASPDAEGAITLAAESGEATVERFRVRLFEEESEATQFQQKYAQFANAYARAQRQALPVRNEPTNVDSRIVYRLRESELMKVLGRTNTIDNLDGLSGYWYRVLTQDGTTGWVFGYYLEVLSDESVAQDEENETRTVLDQFFANVWRPVYFAEMLDSGHIRLERFQPQYGLFPDREARELRLVLPEHEHTFTYTDIIDAGRNRYTFRGSSFQLIVRNDRQISTQYTIDGRGYNIAMQTVEEDIRQEAENERERRRRLYSALRQQGEQMVSNAYGEIRFFEARRFEWHAYDRLVPRAIPPSAGNSGTVELNVFVGSQLRQNYDGALRFNFEGIDDEQSPVFLYQLRNDGLRLVHVPRQQIDEDVIRSEPLSPLILFFSAQQEIE